MRRVKMDNSLATLKPFVEEWFQIQTRRLELQAQADELGEVEKERKKEIISIMKEHHILKFEADSCIVEFKEGDPAPTVRNWDLFYKYILDNNAFELLQKRVS